MDITNALKWRYAAKRMTGQIIPNEVVDTLLEAAHLAPSGIGLQPYEILVVSNAELKQQIYPIAFNQAAVIESSHLLVFAAWDDYTPDRINHVFDYLKEQRGTSNVSENQRNFALNYFAGFSTSDNFHHAAKQAHIALGLVVAAAALNKIDATPMEGFDAKALDNLLRLPEKGLKSSMLMALGYRDEINDWNLPLKKVRKPLNELVSYLD